MISSKKVAMAAWHHSKVSRKLLAAERNSRYVSSDTTTNLPSVLTSWINGEFASSTSSNPSYANLSPVSGSSICEVATPSTEQVNQAVASSQKAFQEWSKLSSAERGKILSEMAALVSHHQEELAQLEAMDTGIPIAQIRSNHIAYSVQTLEYYAALATKGFAGKMMDVPTAGGHADSFAYTRREPLGVCAGINGWNYPLVTMAWKLAPALACGNTFLCKPSECTPMTSLHVAELWKNVLPPGVLQVLVGDGDVAQQLVRHPDVQKVSLTGSTATGIQVAKESSESLKRLTLELGGKSALLIFDDADLESAVQVAIEGNFVNNGQVCTNCTRIFVQRSMLEEFTDKVILRLGASIRMGDNFLEDTNVGPLILPPRQPTAHYERVMDLITQGKEDPDVELVYGGTGYEEEGGYYVQPTVFVCHNDDAVIARQEIFGPVMTILPFDSEDEAVSRANTGTEYGLAAGVMTQDVMRAHRVAKRLEGGTVWVNNWNLSPVEMPFGPFKLSGYGKELGEEAIEHYSQVKTVYVEMGPASNSTFF
jgi:betaine-aldehyde dehydrogenase